MATEHEMINDFLEKKQTDETQMILDFAMALLDCEIQKKEISEDIKVIKTEAKENGILVKQVMSAVAVLKKEMKQDELDKRESVAMYELLSSTPDILYKIETLLEK